MGCCRWGKVKIDFTSGRVLHQYNLGCSAMDSWIPMNGLVTISQLWCIVTTCDHGSNQKFHWCNMISTSVTRQNLGLSTLFTIDSTISTGHVNGFRKGGFVSCFILSIGTGWKIFTVHGLSTVERYSPCSSTPSLLVSYPYPHCVLLIGFYCHPGFSPAWTIDYDQQWPLMLLLSVIKLVFQC